MEKMTRIDRVLKYAASVVDVYDDVMQAPNGDIYHWDYIAHRKGAAAVLAVTNEGKLLMVKQHRNAHDRFMLEIPAGARDSVEEDHLICAARELEEETGYKAGKIVPLITVATTVALFNELIPVYLATELTKVADQKLDADEFVEVGEYELDELLDMIYAQKLQDSKTVSAILAYANMIK